MSFNKCEKTIEKIGNFEKIFFITSTIHNQTFSILGCFSLDLLGFSVYKYTIFLCSYTDFDKNRTKNWKNTKLCKNLFYHFNNPQPKFQCLRLFLSRVIKLCIPYFYALLWTLIITEQTIEKALNFANIDPYKRDK